MIPIEEVNTIADIKFCIKERKLVPFPLLEATIVT